ncbi:MAG: adenylyl-sulfate kinase [Bacteroidetes bacterium]|nr:adenylyl-sulfate kinase [Bacteroidota bacterium]
MAKNIFPVFDQLLTRNDKERILNQRSKVIWLVGLSGSGKTTIARGVEIELNKLGFLTQILDGDNIRSGLSKDLGFSESDRKENIRRIAEVSKILLNSGIICLNGFIAPTKEIRKMAYEIIGRNDVLDVFINAPIEVCEQRDVKGLYMKARMGLIKDFTGINSPFEYPENPDLEIRTDLLSIEESVNKCLEFILPNITLAEKN